MMTTVYVYKSFRAPSILEGLLHDAVVTFVDDPDDGYMDVYQTNIKIFGEHKEHVATYLTQHAEVTHSVLYTRRKFDIKREIGVPLKNIEKCGFSHLDTFIPIKSHFYTQLRDGETVSKHHVIDGPIAHVEIVTAHKDRIIMKLK